MAVHENNDDWDACMTAIREVGLRLTHDPGFREQFFAGIDRRVLVDQPDESPKERAEAVLRRA